MSRLRLAALAVAWLPAACGAPEAAPPPQAIIAAPSAPAGRLLVLDWGQGLLTCARAGAGLEASCEEVSLPGVPARVDYVRQNGLRRYLVTWPLATGDRAHGTALWDASTGVVSPIAHVVQDFDDAVAHQLTDGSVLRYEHLKWYTRLHRAERGGGFAPVPAVDALRGTDYRFLVDGRHLFRHGDGMGVRPESPYFTDVIPGYLTHLYYADALLGAPRRLVSGEQLMEADFVDGGRRVAYWRPGAVDEVANTRTLVLESVEVASGAVRAFSAVKLPVRAPFLGKVSPMRGAPPTLFFLGRPWVLHGIEHDELGWASSLRLQDVATGERFDLRLDPGERLFAQLPDGGQIGISGDEARCWSDRVVTCTRGARGERSCRVRALPSFEVVMTVELAHGAVAADWIDG